MPGKIKVKVLAGRNLPVMDRASDTTDAFVEIKFGGITHKTDVCRKSLNPHWSSTEWYRFEVDESELQDEPLQLRLMDHDTYSANDAIGKVVISLAPLLAREADNAKGTTGPTGSAVLSGWIPVFDTMHGIRGELNIIVKVELFSDFNKYKTSSCGVQFFHCPIIPPGYKATSIHGFVEELVVNDDPEYQWIDKIRTPRASNEARQVAFIKLSNQVQRLVGLKAAELGANAVVGYQQEFDLEGEAGVVARAIGTAVSITPLPTPSQPVNMISCTQQQFQKCLDILATDEESVTDLSQYYKHHHEELQKMITLLNPKGLSMLDSQDNPDDDDELVRQTSLNSYAGSVSIYQDDVSRNSLRNLSDDQIDLNRLLNRKDDDDSDSSGPIQKIKKLKTNFFTKRFTKRKGDRKDEKQEDTVSLKSNSSDTSRISLYDIKNEFKKLKRMKKPKFRKALNKEDEGEGMASILARSVIHARTTLACITETQDSQAENSPCSTMRRTSESEPRVYIDDDKIKMIPEQENAESKKIPEIQFSSLKNISSEDQQDREPRVRRISESCPTSPMAGRTDNLLKLPGDKGYFGSVSSALSGESSIYSSSEDEEESSDLKTDTDDALETTSSIVKSVLKHESDPAFIAQMDRKLTVLQNTPPKISESFLADFDKRVTQSKEEALDISEAPDKEAKEFECKVDNAEENIPHTEKTVTSEPSTSTKDVENEKLEEHKNSGAAMRHVQSTTSSTTPRIVAVTPKRLSEDLTAKVDKKHQDESKGLVHTAMETILMDKAQSIFPDTTERTHITEWHEDVDNEKLAVHNKKESRGSISALLDKVHLHPHFLHHKKDGSSHDIKSGGLIHAAMQTMLIDRAQSMMPDTPEPIPIHTEPDFGEIGKHHKHREHDHKDKESTGLVHSALQTMLMDNVQSVLPDSDKPLPIRTEADFGEEYHKKHGHVKDKESTGLVHSALQTMLIDNVQSVLPDSDEPIPIRTEPIFDDTKSQKSLQKDEESTGLVHSALQTMLIDNIQSVLPDSNEPVPIRTDPIFDDTKSQKSLKKDEESTGLVHSALQTMLIDNIQSVLPDSNEPVPIRTDPMFDDTKSQKSLGKDKESTGLVHSALQTILIDNIQSVLPDSNEPVPIRTEPIFIDTKSQLSLGRDEGSIDLVPSALQTHEVDIKEKDLTDTKMQHVGKIQDNETELKSTGLVKNAMQTMLIDKAQSVLATIQTDETGNDSNESIETKDAKPKSSPEDGKDGIAENTKEHKQHAKTDAIKKKEIDDRNKVKAKQMRAFDERKKHFARQDSVHSVTSNKMSNEPNAHKVTKALLQHFHPILSGGLETIPSVESNDSFDRSIEETNSTSDKLATVGSFDRSDTTSIRTPVEGSERTGGSLNTSAVNVGSGGGAILRPSMNSNNLDMLEYPFLTMTEYPPGFIVHIGGAVCARSVKLVDGGGESALRAAWWTELRTELRAHARALRCNAVIAYTDTAAICEDVCVLSASGTAVVINLDCDFNADVEAPNTVQNGIKVEENEDSCSIAHVPYSPGAGPYRAELSTCGGCRRARVPAVLLAACAKPNKLTAYPKSVNLTAVAARIRRAPPSAEPGARDISDQLPFLEYELHKLLLAKLRMQGANALFSLKTQIAIGERCVMAIASGIATKLTALPPPTPPRIKASEKEKDALEMQKALWDTFTANKTANGYDAVGIPDLMTIGPLPEVESEEPPLDLCADKDACVLELDEAEDVETARALAKRRVHLQAFSNSLHPASGTQPLAFTQVSRTRLVLSSGVGASAAAERQVARALDGAAYKLRRLSPAALNATFQLELPEDEIQLVVSGTAIPLADPSKSEPSENGHSAASQSSQQYSQNSQSSHNSQTDGNDDDIFELDEEQMKPGLTAQEMVEDKSVVNGQVGSAVSLSTLAGHSGSCARRLCALRLLFVRETTAVRELGGLSGFLHTFTCEVLAILRAYTAALGGNALTSFYITQLMLQDNAHKNQGQCLLSVGGDVVHVSHSNK